MNRARSRPGSGRPAANQASCGLLDNGYEPDLHAIRTKNPHHWMRKKTSGTVLIHARIPTDARDRRQVGDNSVLVHVPVSFSLRAGKRVFMGVGGRG